ncbi:MAG: carboxypeptidase-like regulatory domain-containing protein [Gammaproteobacteria bacterium]
MKKYLCLSLLVLYGWCPAIVWAAPHIYGQIWVGSSGAPAQGAKVDVNCGSKVSTSVDATGQYRTPGLPKNTECQLSVTYQKKRSLSLKVPISGSDVRLNLELARWKNNKWLLHKR